MTSTGQPPGLIGAWYRWAFFRLLTRLDAEAVHHVAATVIRGVGAVGPLRRLLTTLTRSRASTPLFGRQVPGRLGLAAGFDKNASMAVGLRALGFAFVEVGTVTARPQPGNPRPRLWRVPRHRGLRNAMGFNNDGAAVIAHRLRRLRRTPAGRRMVLGVNIGKSKLTPASDAGRDYAFSAGLLSPFADYLVVNVSSPNTPGLRALQQIDELRPILEAVRHAAEASAAREVPVLVKIAPDLSEADVDAVADLVNELDLAGVVAVNTTIAHQLGSGGLSGPPVRDRGLSVVRRLDTILDPAKVIIGVGGISEPADVSEYLAAGADAVQAYTGFIYGGATWPAWLNRTIRPGRRAGRTPGERSY